MSAPKPLRLLILGRGRMGQSVQSAAVSRGHEVVGMFGRDDVATEAWPEADVAVDFTAPGSALEVFEACRLRGIPLVSGTTGWTEHWDTVERAVQQIGHAMLWAPNFSIGVFLFRRAMKRVQSELADHNFSLRLTEVHHTGKLDAPSGTALSLAADLEEDGADSVPVTANRLPGVPGTHTVMWENEVDLISLEHAAKNRSGFALGAVHCAEWLVLQGPPFDKIHSMEDVWG